MIAVAAAAAAGGLRQYLDKASEDYALVPPGNVVAQQHPELALLTTAPGGLRAPVVNYLWIRAQNLKEKGRYFDAMQLASLICRLQPRFPGVWSFHAWNMAWNISVATHTPQERWLWVSNGMRLLRDEGIPLNPDALILYKDLAWIFFSKMGQYMDDMHMVYKQRWASQMQQLLAAPPYGTTAETIAAFEPIARAPLDKDPRRQGREKIQPDQLAIVLADANAKRYADLLAEHGIAVDEGLLGAYNRLSRDPSVEVIRISPPKPATDPEQALSDLINSPTHAEARAKLLAFVRAQVLWNVYKMDPQWMLKLMNRYGPIDWREVAPHGLYWATYGVHKCEGVPLDDIDSINTDRIVLNCLKSLTWNGRLVYTANPRQPDSPEISWSSDWRFIAYAQAEYARIIKSLIQATGGEFKNNTFRSGHINYLVAAIQMLYAGGLRDQARDYLQWIKKNYQPTGGQWEIEDVGDFVIQSINRDGRPIPDLARNQLTASLIAGVDFLARGKGDRYRGNVRYAQRVYRIYQDGAHDRNRLPPFEIIVAGIVREALVRPRTLALNLSLLDRRRVYLGMSTNVQLLVYDYVAPYLAAECDANDLDFAATFPPPPGIEQFRQMQRDRLAPTMQ